MPNMEMINQVSNMLSMSDYEGLIGLLNETFVAIQTVSIISSVISLALFVLGIVARWKIYEKADRHGWAAIIPGYNAYTYYSISWGNGWFFLFNVITVCMGAALIIAYKWFIFLLIVPIVNLIIAISTKFKLGLAFNKGIGFLAGLIFLPTIFIIILGFDSSEYASTDNTYKTIEEANAAYKYEEDEEEYKYQDPDEPEVTYTDRGEILVKYPQTIKRRLL